MIELRYAQWYNLADILLVKYPSEYIDVILNNQYDIELTTFELTVILEFNNPIKETLFRLKYNEYLI